MTLVVDGVSSLDSLLVERVHYTYTVDDFETLREDIRYVFRNAGKAPLSVLPLLWRQREVQANMVVLDAEGHNLVYLHSRLIRPIMERFFQFKWSAFVAGVSPEEREKVDRSVEDLVRIFAFDVTPDHRRRAEATLDSLRARFPDSAQLTAVENIVQLASGWYTPFVELSDALPVGESLFVQHGVDVYRHDAPLSLRERLKFYFLGSIEMQFPISFYAFDTEPWLRTQSFHLRVRTPAGLRVVEMPELTPPHMFRGIPTKGFLNYESDSVYLYLTRDAFGKLDENRAKVDTHYESLEGKAREDLETLSETSAKERNPVARFLADIARSLGEGIIRRYEAKRLEEREARITVKLRPTPGIATLLSLLWLVDFLAYAYALLGDVTDANYGLWFSAFLLVVVSVAVFSIDKKILQQHVFAHVLSATAVILVLPALPQLAHFLSAWLR